MVKITCKCENYPTATCDECGEYLCPKCIHKMPENKYNEDFCKGCL